MTVIPDSIEPVEEWRTWQFDGNHLVSHNGAKWTPGEPHKAKCKSGSRYVWAFRRGTGMNLGQAANHANQVNQHYMPYVSYTSSSAIFQMATSAYIPAPRVEPPDGYGYVLEPVSHAAPDAGCTCGIYAGRTPADCPDGDVLGKVKLWGTIVPGTKGSRAEFAYPSELHVPARLADNPALLAYGVPIVTVAKEELAAPAGLRLPPTPKWPMRFAVGANLVACLVNLTLIALRAA